MTDTVEVWIVNEATDDTVLKIEERQRCPVHADVWLNDGWCHECRLDWSVFG